MVNFAPPTDTVPPPIVRQVIREIAEGDVLYISFQRLRQAIVVDLRESEVDRPALLVARHIHTIEQQVRLVEDLRPGFATIQHFSSVPWGGSMKVFAQAGVLAALLHRLPADLTREMMAVFEHFGAMERGEVKDTGPERTPGSTEKSGPARADEPGDREVTILTNTATVAETSAER